MPDRAMWVHQFNQQAEQTPSEYAQTLLPRGISAIYVKAMDGLDWMGAIYRHPLAPSGLDQFGRLVQDFAAIGLTLVPWVVPRTGNSAEAQAHLALGQVTGSLLVDFEYHYDGFFGGSVAAAQSYFNTLKSLSWFGVAPDPRQPGRDYPATLELGATAILPQTYWPAFQQPVLTVLDQALAHCGASGGSFEPILYYNSTAADMQAALDWCDQHGVLSVSLWRMGVANAAQLDAFGASTPIPAPAPPETKPLPKVRKGNNVDTLNRPRDPAVLKAEGFDGVAFVMFDDDRCRRYATAAKAAGLVVFGREARESHGYVLPEALVDVVEIGNEPDGTGSASWSRNVSDFCDDLRIYRGTYPNHTMVVGGMVSGDPSYLQQVVESGATEGYSAIGIHPYDKPAQAAKDLIRQYRAFWSGAVVISEYNRPANEIADFLAMLLVEAAQSFWYCDGDWMVPGMGLLDVHGNPNPSYSALVGKDPSVLQQQIQQLQAELARVTTERDVARETIHKALGEAQVLISDLELAA